MRISDWSSDVCSSDLQPPRTGGALHRREALLRIGIHGLPPAQGARSDHQSGLCRDKGRRSVPHQDYPPERDVADRSEEHTSELQSLMRISYAVFCLKKKKTHNKIHIQTTKKKSNHK